MRKIYEFLISKPLMGALFLILAVAMGFATFIENDFGTSAAKALIYNSWWFELIFFILAVNLFGNLLKHKMWSNQNVSVTLFHVSFFIIIFGSALTRYYGVEGIMHIREGEESDLILSDDSYVSVSVNGKNGLETKKQKVFFSVLSPNELRLSFDNGISIKSKMFVPNAILTPIEADKGEPYIILLGATMMGHIEKTLASGEITSFGSLNIGFEPTDTSNIQFLIYLHDGVVMYKSLMPVVMMQMQSGQADTIKVGEEHQLYKGVLYQVGDTRIVLNDFISKGILVPQYQPETKGLPDAILLSVLKDETEKEMVVLGNSGQLGKPYQITINGIEVSVSYGSIPINIPFFIRLNNFILDRYPGSNSPSSFISEVTLIDAAKEINENHTIFMNNILNYRGYRFYQSSYDTDEQGTILSVNRDWLGTIITYAGYFFMSVGMILALIMPNTRFRKLIRKTVDASGKKKELIAILFIVISMGLNAQDAKPPHVISKELAKSFGELWVQDNDGRIKPMNTMNSELSRKLVKHNSFRGLSADQFILSLIVDKEYWQNFPTITVKNKKIKQLLGIEDGKASFRQFFTIDGRYFLGRHIESAYRKKPSEQNKMEQELIKIDEQVNVFYLIQAGRFLKLFPNPDDTNKAWLFLEQIPSKGFMKEDSLFVRSILSLLFETINSGDEKKSFEHISSILKFQSKYAAKILPSEKQKDVEIFYNETNIFMMLMPVLMIFSIIWLIIHFVIMLYPRWKFKWINSIAYLLFSLFFVFYSLGMIIRWYISGHAPWSNGYESMLYIGWATMLAGIVFVKRNPIVGSVTTLFTSVILLVAHLSWMNPEITNLVPVLKSHWLTIHVAVIVASYGFLGLGALLGFLNLIIIGLKNKKNRKILSITVNELSFIAEMGIIVGLYLLIIGAFLGGVWANESWGRYWGWDPKETWSMITILIYAFILHMRLIPGMKSVITFNFWTLIGFSSVIMTYLGVNYYLAGMHSYAKGDPVPIPMFVYLTGLVIIIVTVYAVLNEKEMKKLNDDMQDNITY
ncbi:MAG: cytochrome c biogenesis protein CcsA [Marinilabiliaceae bacterium]|nr:cytochrome c biogenesis protein CcsA [Marinilabiliaceae bacterium]